MCTIIKDMTLKRNGLGQLGFHVQNDGIVTDVETTGFAYDAGLRKGSRLVEVCKIAVATLTHILHIFYSDHCCFCGI
jgi:predicted metalloprotease with PDZ domain